MWTLSRISSIAMTGRRPLCPVYYSMFYANKDWYRGIKTMITIHNIQYQGKYGIELVDDVLGIPQSAHHILEYDDCVNLMKGAIETAHRVTTVSPTYAQEILDPWYSHELDGILRERSWKLTGILNGIDTVSYDPATDKDIYANYSADDFSNKAENKRALQERLCLAQDPDVPLIGMVTRMVAHKGLDLVKEALDQLMWETNAQFVILGSGDFEITRTSSAICRTSTRAGCAPASGLFRSCRARFMRVRTFS